MKQVKVGVIGLGQRGMGLTGTMLACSEADIVACTTTIIIGLGIT